MKDKKEDDILQNLDADQHYYYFLPKTMTDKPKKKGERKFKKEGVERERPRSPDERDIGVDIVLRKEEKKPFAELRLNALEHSRRIMSVAPTSGISNWVQMGPLVIPNGQTYGGARVLVTGRVTSIVVDPADPRTIYVGAAQGGIWKTADGGNSWLATSDNKESLAIGALAIDPTNHLVLYAGTGEGNFSGDSYYGAGILKTTDVGNTWTNINPKPTGAATGIFTGAYFNRLAINPITPAIIFAATSFGIYRSIDGGLTWSQMKSGRATDIVINPTNPDIAYAVFFHDGIYQTINASSGTPTWNKLTSGLPASGNIFRISLAISPSSPQILYALISDFNTYLINGFYNTTDGGNTWNSIPLPGGNIGGQGYYNLNVAVDPNTPDIVYLSAISLWKATRNATTNTWTFTDIYLTFTDIYIFDILVKFLR